MRGDQELLPLAVDLDGTLTMTDTLLEGAAAAVRRTPWFIPRMIASLGRGKAAFKAEVADLAQLDVEVLPYRLDLVEFLRGERAAGRSIVLATASDRRVAERVATHLGIFDEAMGSDGSVNLRGAAKRDALVGRFGVRGFDYVGDSGADVPVWEACRVAHTAGAMRSVPAAAIEAGATAGRAFPDNPRSIGTWLRAIRVHQWVKNALIGIPAILNHSFTAAVWEAVLAAFFAFSFLASGNYLLNDLFDLEADRRHPSKKRRPLASGELSVGRGMVLALGLMAGGFLCAAAVGIDLVASLAAYLALSVTYSVFLKNKPIIDAVVLAALYTLRVYTGGLITGAYVSPWLFQFSIFCFLSLAFVKRYSELRSLLDHGSLNAAGRGYRTADLSIVSQAGIGSGLMAGLVLALYVNGQEVQRLYPRPYMLWGVCPLFVYWIVRVWLVAHRGNMNQDPILFAFRDRVSYLTGFLIVALVVVGMLPNAR